MTNEYNELKKKAMLPHIVRFIRKYKGYPEGDLICTVCGCANASRNRQRTAYVDDELNYAILCPQCQAEADEYWDEMWLNVPGHSS